MGKEIQISSRQLRTLVLLMALLPLLPVGIMARFMVHSVEEDRQDAVDSAKRVYQTELHRVTEFIGRQPATGSDLTESALSVYGDVFGTAITVRLYDGNGALAAEREGTARGGEVITGSMGAVAPGWRVELDGVASEFGGKEFIDQVLMVLLTPALVTLAGFLITVTAAIAIMRQLRLEELKSDFLATVGHELKTPIASSRVLLETLVDGAAGDNADDYHRLLLKENERLHHLVENFLTFHRIEQGRGGQWLKKAEVEAASVVEEAIEIMRPSAAEAGGVLMNNGCGRDGVGVVNGDREALVTALVCLIDNGLKYSEGKPEVEAGCTVENGGVVFEVRDRGIGIPDDAREQIYEKFFQADRKLSRRHGGCGLGLAIAKSLAEAHGGTIRYSSREGGGTRFVLRVPCVEKKANS